MDYFKSKEYKREPITVLRAYGEAQLDYLRRCHPTIPIEEIKTFIAADINQTLKRPILSLIDYPSYGNAKLKTEDLLTYTDKVIRTNIITPAGVCYQPTAVKESFLKRKILNNGAARKKQKKIMLSAAAAGELALEQRANYLQASIKISNNSIPGAFGSAFNCIYDRPNYNAVTALSRHSIMCGYVHVESMLVGNYYFPTFNHFIDHVMQLARLCPSNLLDIVSHYQLHTPTQQEISDHFIHSLKLYMPITIELRNNINTLLNILSPAEQIYVYYARCLKTLIMQNSNLFRPFLKELFRTDIPVDDTVDPSSIFSFNADMLAMLSGLNADIIDRKTVATAIKEKPEGIRKLIAMGHHMQQQLDTIGPLITTFLKVDLDIADAMSHPDMIRRAVIISDTDSVIFSTQNWIEWYTNRISFDRDAYEINGFVVFLITMSLEHVFARLSANFGAEGDDIYRIAMKNEFLYPLMLRTPLPKQYAGRVAIQEGFVLNKPKEDIKGLSFRSSTMCFESVTAGKNFINWIFDEVIRSGSLKASDCIERALDHEITVIKSLREGEHRFLTTSPIRMEKDYKDAAVSIFYYWKLWQDVFAPCFGKFIIPSKGYDIPIMGNGSALKDERYLSRVLEWDKPLYERLVAFMENNPRTITRLVLPMTLKKIPAILRPIIDIRGVVYSNSTPFAVTLRSLGLGYTGSKEQILLSDMYEKDGSSCLADSEIITSSS